MFQIGDIFKYANTYAIYLGVSTYRSRYDPEEVWYNIHWLTSSDLIQNTNWIFTKPLATDIFREEIQEYVSKR